MQVNTKEAAVEHKDIYAQYLTLSYLQRKWWRPAPCEGRFRSSYQYRKEGSQSQKESVSVAVVIAILGYQNGSHCDGDSRLVRQARHGDKDHNDDCDRDDDRAPCEGWSLGRQL